MKSKTTKTIDQRMSMYIRVLHQEGKVSCGEIKRRFPCFALRSIYRHAKKDTSSEAVDLRKFNRGRPRKLTVRDERAIIRAVGTLRKQASSFTSRRIREEANAEHVSPSTLRRYLRKAGYRYRQARKKGLVTLEDKRIRVRFAREALTYPEDFWQKDIAFYFDGVGFAHKYNPHGEARSTGSMSWRKAKEGLNQSTKGKKEGSGGKMARFFVAVAYNKGVVLCKQHEWTITGENIARFIRAVFPTAFQLSANPESRLFLQDGDPRQNSVVAQEAMEDIGCQSFWIPARSPDLNPIENIFHLIRNKLKEDALTNEITHETYEEFSERIVKTFMEFPVALINKTIDSMPKRLAMVVKSKGDRTKY